MRTRALTGLGALTVGAALLFTGCSAPVDDADAADAPLTFASAPLGEDPTAQNPIKVLTALMSEETGREVKVTDVPDYLAVVEAIRGGHVDFGLMSGFPSALAVNTGEIDALVAWPGSDEPVSTCIVLKDSPLKSLDDITPDTVIAFADPASSSGYFMPVYTLDQAGLKKDVDYKAMFAGGHDMSFMALKQGQVDVACTAVMLTTMVDTDLFPFSEGDTRSIAKSESMPVSTTVIVNRRMTQEKRDLLLAAIPAVFSEKNAEALGPLYGGTGGIEPMLEPKSDIFKPFVRIAQIAGVDISDLG